MRPFGVIARLITCAAILCAVGSAGVAMDLREMPPWLRAMVEPVHLGPAAEVETVQVPAPGALAPAVGIGAGPGAVGVSAPGAGPTSVGGGVSLGAWGAPGGGAVHAPGMGASIGPAPVSISAAAQDWSEAVGSIEGLDRETLAQAGQILAMIRERGMSAEQFAAWTAEHRPAPEVLSAAVAMVGFHRQDNYPTPQPEALAIASGLAVLAGDDLAEVETIPPFGRLWLAILLGSRGDDAGALTAFDSMSDGQLIALPRQTTIMAIAHMIRDVPPTAIAAIERYAHVTHEEAAWCGDLAVACKRSCSDTLLRTELLPWAEQALEVAEGPADRLAALFGLFVASDLLRSPETYRLALSQFVAYRHQQRMIDTTEAALLLAAANAATTNGDLTTAVSVLRGLVEAGPSQMRGHAAARLVALLDVQGGPTATDVIPPRVVSARPSELSVRLPQGIPRRVTAAICGSASLSLTSVGCSVEGTNAELGERVLWDQGSMWLVTIALGDTLAPGTHRGSLTVTTNDPTRSEVSIPLRAEVYAPT